MHKTRPRTVSSKSFFPAHPARVSDKIACHLTASVSLLIFFDSTLARRVGPWGCFDGWRYCAQEAVGFWGAAQYAPVVQNKSNAPLLSAPKSGVSLAWETRNVYLYPFMSWYDNDSKIWFKKMYACHRNLNNEHAHKNLKRDKGFFCAQKSQSWQTHIYSYHDMIMTQKVKKNVLVSTPSDPCPPCTLLRGPVAALLWRDCRGQRGLHTGEWFDISSGASWRSRCKVWVNNSYGMLRLCIVSIVYIIYNM